MLLAAKGQKKDINGSGKTKYCSRLISEKARHLPNTLNRGKRERKLPILVSHDSTGKRRLSWKEGARVRAFTKGGLFSWLRNVRLKGEPFEDLFGENQAWAPRRGRR